MIYIFIKKEIKNFETDIRDLCLAFFTYKKIIYLFENDNGDYLDRNGKEYQINEEDIVVKDFFNGSNEVERIKVKCKIKRDLYDYLYKITKKNLFWGTLTGIRPVTIVTKIFDEIAEKKYNTNYIELDNDKKDKIKNENSKILKDEYYVSDDKIKVLNEISEIELKILNRKEIRNYKNSYSIYIGVPFCKTTCLYCSFTSFNIDKYKDYVDLYIDTLEKEILSRIEHIKSSYGLLNNEENINMLKPLTLYIGGGTPTSLDEEHFEKFLSLIDKYIDKSSLVEYTVEAGRPDTINDIKFKMMKEHNVSRISINPQTFNQKTLDLIGRKHKTSDVIDKYNLARDLGFDNINMDIILGLPNEYLGEVKFTLLNIEKLKPDSFTVHSLALKRAARLNLELENWMKNYYLAGLDEKIIEGKREIDNMFDMSMKTANRLNLNSYYLYRQKNMAGNLENIGYAKEKKESIYNIMMMSERHSVFGFGLATTKEIFYKGKEKIIKSEEGYKSIVDYIKSY